jgi:YbbR domain-containing protein
MLTRSTIEPASVEIVGPAEIINGMNKITPENVDISGAAESFTRTLDIRRILPEDVALRDGEPAEVTASFTVEPVVARLFDYPWSMVTVTGWMPGIITDVINDGPLWISVRGVESEVNALTVEDIKAELDLSRLKTGEQSVELSVSLPGGFALAEPTYVKVLATPVTPEEVGEEATEEATEEAAGEEPAG